MGDWLLRYLLRSRRSARVTFVAEVSSAKSANAQRSANNLNAATLNTHVASAKTALGSAYSGITVTVTGVEAPQVTASTGSSTLSGAGQATTLSLAGLAAVFLAL